MEEELVKFWTVVSDGLASLDAFIVLEARFNKADTGSIRRSMKKSNIIAKRNINTFKKALLDLESEELKNWR